jgi:hypothetical protein
MPQPTISSVHIDAALSNISTAYRQSADGFIADKVFPIVGVQHRSDKYHTFDKNDWMRDDVEQRASGSESAGSGFNLSTGTYSCNQWSLHKDISDRERLNADPSVPMETAAAEWLAQKFLISKERQWATQFFATSLWGTDVVGGTNFTAWDDQASSDPEVDIDAGKETILKNTGLKANTFIAGWDVDKALCQHPLIKDRYKYTSSSSITRQLIAEFLGVDNYFVSEAVYASNNENATGVYDFALGSNALLCHVAKAPGIMTPSAGYTFSWDPAGGVVPGGVTIKNIRLDSRESDRIEGSVDYDQKLVAADLGYFFSAATS